MTTSATLQVHAPKVYFSETIVEEIEKEVAEERFETCIKRLESFADETSTQPILWQYPDLAVRFLKLMAEHAKLAPLAKKVALQFLRFGICHRAQSLSEEVVLQVKGKEVTKMNKAYLICLSDVFTRMFKNPMQENEKNVIDFIDCTEETVQQFKQYLYTGIKAASPSDSSLVELYNLSRRYEIETLKKICREELLTRIQSKYCDTKEKCTQCLDFISSIGWEAEEEVFAKGLREVAITRYLALKADECKKMSTLSGGELQAYIDTLSCWEKEVPILVKKLREEAIIRYLALKADEYKKMSTSSGSELQTYIDSLSCWEKEVPVLVKKLREEAIIRYLAFKAEDLERVSTLSGSELEIFVHSFSCWEKEAPAPVGELRRAVFDKYASQKGAELAKIMPLSEAKLQTFVGSLSFCMKLDYNYAFMLGRWALEAYLTHARIGYKRLSYGSNCLLLNVSSLGCLCNKGPATELLQEYMVGIFVTNADDFQAFESLESMPEEDRLRIRKIQFSEENALREIPLALRLFPNLQHVSLPYHKDTAALLNLLVSSQKEKQISLIEIPGPFNDSDIVPSDGYLKAIEKCPTILFQVLFERAIRFVRPATDNNAWCDALLRSSSLHLYNMKIVVRTWDEEDEMDEKQSCYLIFKRNPGISLPELTLPPSTSSPAITAFAARYKEEQEQHKEEQEQQSCCIL